MMRTEKSRVRRYLMLTAAAATVAVSAAAAQAAPAGAQTVFASRPVTRITAASAQAATLTARPVKAGQSMVSAASDDTTLYTICLTNADTHCLAWSGTSVVLNSSGAKILWKIVSNATDETYEALGVTQGTTANDGLCLAAAANSSGGNNRVYATSNCFGNPYASWQLASSGRGGDYLENQNSINQGNPYKLLTDLNMREGAFLYVEPQESGTWQTWSAL